MSNEKKFKCLLFPRLLLRLSIFPRSPLYFLAFVGFVNETFVHFHSESQKDFQIKMKISIYFRFKLNAVFIEWSQRMIFLSVAQQNIVNYCDFSYKFSGNCQSK